MEKKQFIMQVCRIVKAYPGNIDISDRATLDAWYSIVGHADATQVSDTVTRILAEEEYIRSGTNIGALILQRLKPKISTATIEDALNRSVALNRSSDNTAENPYAFLKRIDPSLCEMAENCGVFDRFASEEQIRWRVKDTAKQYAERAENQKRGYHATAEAPLALPGAEKIGRLLK